MVGTIKSIFDSVEIENEENKEEYVLYETPIPAEVYGANVELISIPHPNIQNIHKIESNNKKLFQKAIELNTRVKELKDEIKELRKIQEDLNDKCEEKFKSLKDLDLAQAFGATHFQAKFNSILWDRVTICNIIITALRNVRVSK